MSIIDLLKKLKAALKNNVKTILAFIITLIVSFPVNILLLLLVVISSAYRTNHYSVYILEDLLSLAEMMAMPLIILLVVHTIPLLIMMNHNKKENGKENGKFNIRTYIILALLHVIPYSFTLFLMHSNFSLDYREERIIEVKRYNGEIVEGTLMYDLLSRYLNVNNLDDIRDMVRQDQLILSYEYRYITNYLDYIDYVSTEDSLKKALKIYNQEYPEYNDYIIIDKYTLLYSDMIKEFENPNITVEDVHSKITEFMNNNICDDRGDGRSKDDDLDYTLPLIVAYENIHIQERISKGFTDPETERIVLETRLEDSLTRITNFINGNSYDYQYGYDKQIKDSEIYKEYCDMISSLLSDDDLTSEKVSDTLNKYNQNYDIDIKNEKLKQLQILFQY